MLEKLQEKWDDILNYMKEEHDISDVSFKTWLLPLKLYSLDNNKLYIYIFNAWNKLNINNEKILTEDNKSAIANALNEHNEEDIINAIENFGVVYKSDHYYNYAWILKSFLSRSNGINRFMEDGDIWLDYKAKQKNVKRNSIFPEDFDIEKYID